MMATGMRITRWCVGETHTQQSPARLVTFSGVQQSRRALAVRSSGKDSTVGAWIDLASFVSSSGTSSHTPFDELAEKIGDKIAREQAPALDPSLLVSVDDVAGNCGVG